MGALERAAESVIAAGYGSDREPDPSVIVRAVLMSVRDFALMHWKDDDDVSNQSYMLNVADCMNRISMMEDNNETL